MKPQSAELGVDDAIIGDVDKEERKGGQNKGASVKRAQDDEHDESSDAKRPLITTEHKRDRERQRRMNLNTHLDQLRRLLLKVEPTLNNAADRDALASNRLNLLDSAIHVLNKLYTENEERKRVIAGLLSPKGVGQPTDLHQNAEKSQRHVHVVAQSRAQNQHHPRPLPQQPPLVHTSSSNFGVGFFGVQNAALLAAGISNPLLARQLELERAMMMRPFASSAIHPMAALLLQSTMQSNVANTAAGHVSSNQGELQNEPTNSSAAKDGTHDEEKRL